MTRGHQYAACFAIYGSVQLPLGWYLAPYDPFVSKVLIAAGTTMFAFAFYAYRLGKPNSNQLSKPNAQYKGSPSRQR